MSSDNFSSALYFIKKKTNQFDRDLECKNPMLPMLNASMIAGVKDHKIFPLKIPKDTFVIFIYQDIYTKNGEAETQMLLKEHFNWLKKINAA